jgi:4-hydroxy-2-oxoheptanedioate aldolase
VETVDELQKGIAAMRFRSRGGTRSDDVGAAPAHWGMSEAEYREKADVWPLNPRGELVAQAIIESAKGFENLEAIAATPGLAVLTAGAGTMRSLYPDPAQYEAALQKILAVCKKNNIACGFPTNEQSVEARIKEGWMFQIMQGWNESFFRAVDIGKRVGGR